MDTKQQLRAQYRIMRERIEKEQAAAASITVQNQFLHSEVYRNAKNIMLYMPIKNEVDTSVVRMRARRDKKGIIYPVTNPKTYEITPVLWDGTEHFHTGAFSVQEPQGTAVAPNCADVLILPGIAFSRRGERIGFGKGCYDRLLSAFGGITVGFCYQCQLCESLPSEPHDALLDYIVTENQWFFCKREREDIYDKNRKSVTKS